jgi:hypothetical protein
MSGRTDPLAGFRRLRFSFFSDEPTLSKRRWSTIARGLRWLGRTRAFNGPVAQLVRARA